MRIGLIDVDGHNHFPNLALMKLSAYHKRQGNTVEWYAGFTGHYDKVYMSKVFTFSEDEQTIIDADEIIKGGTGYGILEDLPEEIEHITPDYSIYPSCDCAMGFSTRGCIRNCPWCIVPKKEGYIRANDDWKNIVRNDSKKIIFMDNNVLACDYGLNQIDELGHEKIWVDFNQGLDARLITPATAKMLGKLHWINYVRLSCDTDAMLPVIEQATAYLKESGIAKSRLFCYMLVTDIPSAEKRALELDKMGVIPFAQPYRDYENHEPTQEQKDFARWVNMKSAFHSCSWADYKKRGNKHNEI